MSVELSPAGAMRERGVPCRYCRTETFHFTPVCDRCRDERLDQDEAKADLEDQRMSEVS